MRSALVMGAGRGDPVHLACSAGTGSGGSVAGGVDPGAVLS
jgi:hypothetical protein